MIKRFAFELKRVTKFCMYVHYLYCDATFNKIRKLEEWRPNC